jgi:ATP-dependent protease ClpP protease subunit
MKISTIEVYGDIGFYDWLTDTLLDGAWFSSQLAGVPNDADKLEVRINSFGGITAEGLTMYNRMRDFARKRRVLNPDFTIETHVDGYAYSAGSLIALGGDKVIMHNGTQFMIHNAMGGEFGDYRAMLAAHDWLKGTSEAVAQLYAAETGIKQSDIQDLMDATTFFNADEAVKAGFADAVETLKEDKTKDTSLYKGVDPRPLNYAKYVQSGVYKSVSYQRPKESGKDTSTSPQSTAHKLKASQLAKSLSELMV